jgi:hypothetical protein
MNRYGSETLLTVELKTRDKQSRVDKKTVNFNFTSKQLKDLYGSISSKATFHFATK